METNFIRRAIDAIIKVGDIQSVSEPKGQALAIDYQLRVHPDLWLGIKDCLGKLSPIGFRPSRA
jgi:hypothetical protein